MIFLSNILIVDGKNKIFSYLSTNGSKCWVGKGNQQYFDFGQRINNFNNIVKISFSNKKQTNKQKAKKQKTICMLSDLDLYYIPIDIPCSDTENFANLIWLSGLLHCRFLIPYQYTLKLMTSQCISATRFVENVDCVTMKTVCTKNNLAVYLCFWSSEIIYFLENSDFDIFSFKMGVYNSRNEFIFVFFLFGDGVRITLKKHDGNCIIARSSWCKVSVIFFFGW
jgi:hypothetical protein